MMDDSGRVFVELDNGPSYWLPEADLQQVVYLKDPDIEDPKGILEVKNVRLVIGEGANKVEVGTAEITMVPNGDAMILLTVTNPQIEAMLGGNKIQGIIPKVVDPETPVEEEPLSE